MIRGRFAEFRHDHHFAPSDGGTTMVDTLEFRSPFGFLGALVDRLVLKPYLTRLLCERNAVIQREAWFAHTPLGALSDLMTPANLGSAFSEFGSSQFKVETEHSNQRVDQQLTLSSYNSLKSFSEFLPKQNSMVFED